MPPHRLYARHARACALSRCYKPPGYLRARYAGARAWHGLSSLVAFAVLSFFMRARVVYTPRHAVLWFATTPRWFGSRCPPPPFFGLVRFALRYSRIRMVSSSVLHLVRGIRGSLPARTALTWFALPSGAVRRLPTPRAATALYRRFFGIFASRYAQRRRAFAARAPPALLFVASAARVPRCARGAYVWRVFTARAFHLRAARRARARSVRRAARFRLAQQAQTWRAVPWRARALLPPQAPLYLLYLPSLPLR